MPEDNEFVAAMAREMEMLAGQGSVRFTITPMDLYTLIALLQLAWRHQRLPERQRAVVERFAHQFALVFESYPTLRASLEMGWRTQLDQPYQVGVADNG